MNQIEDAFQNFALERIVTLNNQFTKTEQYKNLSKQCIEQFKMIEAYVPAHIQSTLYEYEENMNHLHGITQDYIYLQGIKDGTRLIKHLLLP